MRFHWVSQNQTGQHEIPGGYMWCPKTNQNNTRNAYYDMMRDVKPGDVVFSFRDRSIAHIGIVTSEAFEARKPTSFGAAGAGWLELGWMVRVEYETVPRSFMPAMHMDVLGPLLPDKYSPVQADGRGNQMYFTTLPDDLGHAILALTGMTLSEVHVLLAMLQPAIENSHAHAIREAEEIIRLEEERIDRLPVKDTEKLALIASRLGQGTFRVAVQQIEPRCRVTGVSDPAFLRASHIKPWRVADNRERLDGYNGLMLTPTVDHLFDQGYISFRQSGGLMYVSNVPAQIWTALHMPIDSAFSVGQFHHGQQLYLEYHRDVVFRG